MSKFLCALAALFLVSCGGDFNQGKAQPDEPAEDGCICNTCECYEDGSCICTDCECPTVCCEDGCDGDDCAMGACDCEPGCDCGCNTDDAGSDGGNDGHVDGGDGGGCPGGSCKPFVNWSQCHAIEYSQAPDGTLGDRLRCL